MNRMLRFDWLPERARWGGQDGAGKMVLSCPLRITRCIPQENSALFPYNKSFIDQACSVKMTMADYWPRLFSAILWTLTSSQSINTQKKKLASNPAILLHAW